MICSWLTLATRRVVRALLGTVILGLCQAGTAHADAGESLYRFTAAASWIDPLVPEYAAALPAAGVTNGAWFLLLDRQINVRKDGEDYYLHAATRVVNATGVQDQSQIDITVDPSFQTLQLHSLQVVRNGRVIDQKALARITQVHQEKQLREQIYNGSFDIDIQLADVRVGDVVEYSYTMHSGEHIFPGLAWNRLSVGWSVPLHRQRLRLLAPQNEHLQIKVEDHSEPIVRQRNGLNELTWEWRELAAIEAEDDRPSWFSPWPRLEFTSVKDWAEVARRVTPLFAVPDVHTSRLSEELRKIRAAGGTAAEQALHALQFVQQEIRYVSISIGPGAFTPAQPEEVLSRRFGDCKDKALLLSTMLQQLGVEARPALVHSRRGHMLDSALPSPYDFDHAIVRAQIGNAVYWLDGTSYRQLSPLSSAAPADFERALVLDGSTTGLQSIPKPNPDAWRKRSEVLIDASRGINKPASLKISTFYEGDLADETRADLMDQTVANLDSNYTKYIARYYPGVRSTAPPKILDDLARNIIEVRESYEIDKPFPDSHGRRELFLQGDEIDHYLGTLDTGVRSSPLSIPYPRQVRQTVRALLPESWSVESADVHISNPAFSYDSKVSYSQGGPHPEVALTYSYQALSDSVGIAALPRYLADRKQAYDDVGYSLWQDSPPPRAVATLQERLERPVPSVAWWVTGLAALLGIWASLRYVYRFNPLPAQALPHWPVGIRGWLIIPAVLIPLMPLGSAIGVVRELLLLAMKRWDAGTDGYSLQLKLALLAVLAFAAFFTVVCIFGAYLFYRRRTSAAALFISLYWIAIARALITWAIHAQAGLTSSRSNGITAIGLVLDVSLALGMTLYLSRSRRARATFVRRLPSRVAQSTAAVAPIG